MARRASNAGDSRRITRSSRSQPFDANSNNGNMTTNPSNSQIASKKRKNVILDDKSEDGECVT